MSNSYQAAGCPSIMNPEWSEKLLPQRLPPPLYKALVQRHFVPVHRLVSHVTAVWIRTWPRNLPAR